MGPHQLWGRFYACFSLIPDIQVVPKVRRRISRYPEALGRAVEAVLGLGCEQVIVGPPLGQDCLYLWKGTEVGGCRAAVPAEGGA